jgi:[acyl-carrier-protein] S-malonyltransferase
MSARARSARLERRRFRVAIPVVTNVDAAAESDGARLCDALVRQIDSPVRWVESVQLLAREGVDRALEVGPGNVLAGLVRRIEKSIRVEGHS